jgi:hypothetical protein
MDVMRRSTFLEKYQIKHTLIELAVAFAGMGIALTAAVPTRNLHAS